jgi:sugar phosphate isomerase/epimerase
MRIGVVLEAFLDVPLEEVLDTLAERVPAVTDLEVGVGGFAPAPHCDVPALLGDAGARARWVGEIDDRGFLVSALNVSGNPLHPDAAIAGRHDGELRNAVRLAAELGIDRVVAMGGCPAGAVGDRTAHFDSGGWLPYLAGIYERQWEERIRPYWSELAAFAAAERPELRICLELHPGSAAYNVETFERLAGLAPNLAVNLDPSHLFWQWMDPIVVAAALAPRIGHAHAKDVVFNRDALALNGLLDHRWTARDAGAPWTFAAAGRGHNPQWWRSFLEALGRCGVETISIEHEDPLLSPFESVASAANALVEARTGLLQP